MSFFPARGAAEKFRLRRSTAAAATIHGRLVKGWLRFSAPAEISSMVFWQDRVLEHQSHRSFLEQHGRAATSIYGFSPARTVTRGFFKTILARPQQRSTDGEAR